MLTDFYETGPKKVEFCMKDDKEEGKAIGFYENGNTEFESIFKDGKLDKTEKRLNDLITLSMFVFFIIINTLIAGTALQYN